MIFLQPFKRYFDFSGRARRKEYWLYSLFVLITSYLLTIAELLIGIYSPFKGVAFLSMLFYLFVLIPSISVTVRRLHDTNRRGWWYLLLFIPLIGQIWLFILLCLNGTRGANRFGVDPKELRGAGSE